MASSVPDIEFLESDDAPEPMSEPSGQPPSLAIVVVAAAFLMALVGWAFFGSSSDRPPTPEIGAPAPTPAPTVAPTPTTDPEPTPNAFDGIVEPSISDTTVDVIDNTVLQGPVSIVRFPSNTNRLGETLWLLEPTRVSFRTGLDIDNVANHSTVLIIGESIVFVGGGQSQAIDRTLGTAAVPVGPAESIWPAGSADEFWVASATEYSRLRITDDGTEVLQSFAREANTEVHGALGDRLVTTSAVAFEESTLGLVGDGPLEVVEESGGDVFAVGMGGTTLAVGRGNGLLDIYEEAAVAPTTTTTIDLGGQDIGTLCVNGGGSRVLVIGRSGAAAIFDIATETQTHSFEMTQESDGAAWASDDQLVYVRNTELEALDVQTGEVQTVARFRGTPGWWWLSAHQQLCG